MKYWRYAVQYLTFVSLILLTCSGIYDLVTGVQAANSYLQWRSETYGVTAGLIVSSYVILLFRGVMVAFGCGIWGILQTIKGKIRISYLIILALWTLAYIQSAFYEAYKGIKLSDVIQFAIAIFCVIMAIIYKVTHRQHTPNASSAPGPRAAPRAATSTPDQDCAQE